MTDELTLREKAMIEAEKYGVGGDRFTNGDVVNAIATLLEDTGSPAHMRVAAELRGE